MVRFRGTSWTFKTFKSFYECFITSRKKRLFRSLNSNYLNLLGIVELPAEIYHREHTILLSRKRVNKRMKRMNSLPLSSAVFSYATLQGNPLLSSPVEHCSAKLVPKPFRAFNFFYFYNYLTRVATLCLRIFNAIREYA